MHDVPILADKIMDMVENENARLLLVSSRDLVENKEKAKSIFQSFKRYEIDVAADDKINLGYKKI